MSEVPYMLDSIEDAERFCNIFIPKLDRGATLCQKGPKSESKYETLIFIEYIRGLMPFVMAYYEKDFISRNEFVEQSYSQWNSVKEQYFSRDQLENQIQRLSANMILDFNTMMVNHLVNYDNLIAFKCDNIMDEEPMLVIPAIEDVNRLRSEYVTHMHDSLNFYRVGPSTCFDEHMKGNLYLYIAREFRNIVSKSWVRSYLPKLVHC